VFLGPGGDRDPLAADRNIGGRDASVDDRGAILDQGVEHAGRLLVRKGFLLSMMHPSGAATTARPGA